MSLFPSPLAPSRFLFDFDHFFCALPASRKVHESTSYSMSNAPPTRPSRSTSLSRSQPPSSQPPPVPSGYPPVATGASHYPPAAELHPSERDPLAVDNSPNLQSSATLPPGAAYDFGDPDAAYTAVNLNPIGLGHDDDDEQARYFHSVHARDQSLDLVDSYHNQPRTSLSTHNSRTQLRTVGGNSSHGGGILPTGIDGDFEKHFDSRPIHPGASVQMGSPNPNQQSARAEKMYGSGEKGSPTASGYNSPRNGHGHGRGGSRAGLGQWSSPGGGNSPYGKLGGNDESGFNSAASSNPNLQFAEGEFSIFLSQLLPFLYPELIVRTPPATGDFIGPSKNWFSRAFYAVYNSSFIVRWM